MLGVARPCSCCGLPPPTYRLAPGRSEKDYDPCSPTQTEQPTLAARPRPHHMLRHRILVTRTATVYMSYSILYCVAQPGGTNDHCWHWAAACRTFSVLV